MRAVVITSGDPSPVPAGASRSMRSPQTAAASAPVVPTNGRGLDWASGSHVAQE
jgi:hypothetical protein